MLRVKERKSVAEFGYGSKAGRCCGPGRFVRIGRGGACYCKQRERRNRQNLAHQKSPGTKRGFEAMAARYSGSEKSTRSSVESRCVRTITWASDPAMAVIHAV